MIQLTIFSYSLIFSFQVPFLRDLFVVTPLNWEEWKGVLLFSAPVIVIDEVCKFITRNYVNPPDAPGLLLDSKKNKKNHGLATNGDSKKSH